MLKFRASEILNYAKSLADLQNSNFITFGDGVRMLNSSYRKIYQDLIDNGEQTYIQEVEFIGRGTNQYKLPDDFYQLAIICDSNGNEIPRRRMASYKSDTGYEIKNDCIYLYNCDSEVIMKYYPVPDTITYKQERTTNLNVDGYTPVSAFNEFVLYNTGKLYNVQTGLSIETGITANNPSVIGRDAFIVKSGSTWSVYYNMISAVQIDTLLKPIITSSGNFVEGGDGDITWANDDLSTQFVKDGTNVKLNSAVIGTIDSNEYTCRVIYWNGKWALLTKSKIIYEDGSWETTDCQNALFPMKASTESGYGYLVRTGNDTFAIEGWTPDTVIDYPNHILFDLTAYDLAIQFRMKQNSDAAALKEAYSEKRNTYIASISNDEANYVTIRNTDRRNFFGYW